jgi:prohibitin 1
MKIVHSGEKGLVFRFGALQDKVLDQGIHWKTPIMTKIKTVTIRPQQMDYVVHVGPDGAITKDNQTLGAGITVFYSYKDSELVKMWGEYGTEKMESILQNTLKESFKIAVGAQTIFSVPENQGVISQQVLDDVRNRMKDYPVEVNELKITNYDWSDAFDQAIATTMQKAQEVKQAEQELLITEQQANKAVKEAEAAKNAAITKAEGEKESARLLAEAKALEGEGIKKYNQSVQANMELEIKLRQLENEKLRIEKWNGEYVPQNYYGPIPISNETRNLQGQ